jgi:hypothetical protein
MSEEQLLRALEASLKAWDAAERASFAKFKADTDALRDDFNRAMAALRGSR